MLRFAVFLVVVLGSLENPVAADPLIDKINDYRRSAGLSLLSGENALQATADAYCAELAARGILSHRDNQGKRVLDRYREQGGTSSSAGEILGTAPDCNSLFNAWMKSPPHRSVIQDPRWTRIASAVVEKNGQYIAVVLFSCSEIGSYSLEKEGDALKIVIYPLDGGELSVLSFRGRGKEPVRMTLDRSRLPVVLVINGGSDYLYIGDEILNKTH